MSLHKEHRKRLRRRFLENGLDGFEDHEALEMLLYYSIARKDTNEIAHLLLDEFGGLPQVLSAPPEQLQKIEGIGEYSAAYMSFINDFIRFVYSKKKEAEFTALQSLDDCGDYLYPRYLGRRNEVVYLLCLDAKRKVLCCQMVGEGSVNSAGVPIRRVVEMALAANATMVVLAHNHPSGIATPSYEDIATTRRIAAALDGVEIILADHIVVADDDFTSMVQSGYYRPGECAVQM